MKILKATWCFKTHSSGNLPILAIPTTSTNTLTKCHSWVNSGMEVRMVGVMERHWDVNTCTNEISHSCKKSMAFTLLTSQNSLMFKSIIFRSLIPNFSWSGQWTWKVQMNINLHSQVQCSFHCTHLHICICSTLFCKYLLYVISWKPNTGFHHWCYVTYTQSACPHKTQHSHRYYSY